MRSWVPDVRLGVLALCLAACAPRGPAPLPDDVGRIVDAVEQALMRRDFAGARRHVDFRYRLAESLGTLWQSGPEAARVDLEARMAEMFDETSEQQLARFTGKRMERRLLARAPSGEVWVESRVPCPAGAACVSFAWQYRLTPRGTSWAITQREYLVDGMRSDSTRFWPMARSKIAETFGRPPTLSELAANLPGVMGTMRMRRYRIPNLDGIRQEPPEAPKMP